MGADKTLDKASYGGPFLGTKDSGTTESGTKELSTTSAPVREPYDHPSAPRRSARPFALQGGRWRSIPRPWGSTPTATGCAWCSSRPATAPPTWCRCCPAHGAPNLTRLLADAGILKIFHFARFDLGVLQQALGVMPAPVYCTKIASRLARTYTDKHGLKDLVREVLGIDLSKQQQMSDWGAETLTDAQVAYAAPTCCTCMR